MAPGLVYESFLIDLPENFLLFLHDIFWYFPNRQATQGQSFLTLLRFLGIIPLLDNLRRDLKEQWFSLWFQTRISLLFHPKRSVVDHRLAIYSLISLSSTASFPNSSKLVVIWDGLLVEVRRSSPTSRLRSWPKPRIFQVSP